MTDNTARLLISCPDQRGLVAAVAGFVLQHNGNLLEADQHTDPHYGHFFMRVEIDLTGFALNRVNFAEAWRPIAERFNMRWRIAWGNQTKRMAILVSKAGHCLTDLLWRQRTGELRVEIPLVIGNHADLAGVVAEHGAAFHHVSIDRDSKDTAQQRMQSLLKEARIDFVVLARYMQILTADFVSAWPEAMINIHHSFLPAFVGPRPYHQAFERGVKIIGTTSHYVTADLDAGPIIAQGTLNVSHRDTVDDLVRKGRDLERTVLAAAVRAHVEDRILVHQNKTVIFE